GYGLCGAAAFFGGELAFGLQLGAKHRAEPVAPPADFVPTVGRDALSENVPVRIEVAGIPVLLTRRGRSLVRKKLKRGETVS
ncbi:MAG: hypothetical protein ACLPSH_13320, partial [Vulcanimicrobiaceae bacterium]